MARERRITVVAGQRRSGKSTLTAALARQAFDHGARGHTKIVDPGGSLGGTFPDDLDEYVRQLVEENTSAIAAGRPTPTTLLVMDDADAYLPQAPRGRKQRHWIDLYIRSAQLDLDIIVNAKRLQGLPPMLCNGADWVYCFRLPRSDVAGRDRAALVIDADDIPTEPYHFTQIDPNGDRKYRGMVTRDGAIRYLA